jgi:hypothetical protein
MVDAEVILHFEGLKFSSQLAAFPPRFERKVGAGVKQEVPKECDIAITGLAWNGQVMVIEFAKIHLLSRLLASALHERSLPT